jgi:outer membrane lipoprotein-sorting protein
MMKKDELTPDSILGRSVAALLDAPVPEDRLPQALAAARATVAKAVDSRLVADADHGNNGTGLWRRIAMHKRLVIGTSSAIVATAIVLSVLYLSDTPIAFSEVIRKISDIQTFHAKIILKGRPGEMWGKRPNKLRIVYGDGTYEISNGPTLWVVDEKANKATQRLSWYFQDAQKRGLDVVDMLAALPLDENVSGFFSEEPVDRIRRDGRVFDVYRVELKPPQPQIWFEALVDRETQFLHSMKLDLLRDGRRETQFSVTLMDYDQEIPDEMFAFEPKDGMDITTKEPKKQESDEPAAGGSSLSGTITWASTGKPVGGARVTVMGQLAPRPEGGSRAKYLVHAETDRNGRWRAEGARSGHYRLLVRSWEFEWPAVAAFADNVGSEKDPAIEVDGRSHYGDLDFTVHNPEEFFSRVTISVTDEDGNPVEGVGAGIFDGMGSSQSMYAARRQQFTGPDGQFDAANIWPMKIPAYVSIAHRDPDGPYASRGVKSNPFMVESKKSYHLDMTLPFQRELTVRVVDPTGKPVEGVSVSALDEQGVLVFPLDHRGGKWIFKFTDAEGMATIRGLVPDKDFIIGVKRRPPDAKYGGRALASAIMRTKAPTARKPEFREVTFDDRPIRIEGNVAIPSGARPWDVYCLVGKAPRQHVMPFLLSNGMDDNGRFVLEGVPAGEVRVGYRLAVSKKEVIKREATIHTEPGRTYVLETVEDKLVVARTEMRGE